MFEDLTGIEKAYDEHQKMPKSAWSAHLERQIEKLGNYILKEHSGLISEGGACDVAIRIMTFYKQRYNAMVIKYCQLAEHHEAHHDPDVKTRLGYEQEKIS